MKDLKSLQKPQKQGFQRTLGYVGGSSAWSLGLFIFFFYMIAIISFLTDALRLDNFDPLWFLVSGAAFFPPILIAVVYKFAYLNRRPEKRRVVLNLAVAALAGSSRNVSVGLLASWAGLDETGLWPFRFFGGGLMGVSIFVLWSVGNGSKIQYLNSLRRLGETQDRLASTRLQIPVQVAETNEELQNRTKKALYPQLEAIRELLGDGNNISGVLEKLRFTITDQIRPLMREISNSQPVPFEVQNLERYRFVRASLPDRFSLHDKLLVTWSAFVEALGLSIWLVAFGSPNGLWDLVVIFINYFVVLSVFKLLIPNARNFARFNAITYILLASFAASLANIFYIYYWLDFETTQFLMLSGFATLGGLTGPILLMYLSVRIEKQTAIELQVSNYLLAIAKENALFAQKLWVFRKRWLLILHGNVQSALTAALTRLQGAAEIDAVLIEMVKQDLNRAQSAVETNLKEDFSLQLGLDQLQEVWLGICEISVQVSSRAERALDRNLGSSFCVNEIAKEAVSNAVRHGDATQVSVLIDRIEDDLLVLEVTNNGTPPKDSPEAGIGSEMLDEVCLAWELSSEKRQVVLRAELPVAL